MILIAEGTTDSSASVQKLPPVTTPIKQEDLLSLFKTRRPNESVLDLWNKTTFSNRPFDPKNSFAREMLIENLLYMAKNTPYSEAKTVEMISENIKANYKTDEDRLNFLSALSSRLYRTYNNARNPFYNTSTHNPENRPISKGDMTINQLFAGAADFNAFDGGVCNDISEAVAMIGEKLFQTKDVLIVNSRP